MTDLTKDSKDLFIALVKDADNWSGMPLWGGNVGGSRKDNGNLTDLKKNDLVVTDRDEGCDWIIFTEKGKSFATELGFDASDL